MYKIQYVACFEYDVKTRELERVCMASVTDREYVVCFERPLCIRYIDTIFQPKVGIPNIIQYWYESIKHQRNIRAMRKSEQRTVTCSDTTPIIIGVENHKEYLYLFFDCGIPTRKIYDDCFIPSDKLDGADDSFQLSEFYALFPDLTYKTWKLARKVEKM